VTSPLRVHGSEISYFTGKLEGYLRYKEIPYERVPMTRRGFARARRETGVAQMPAVELPDGRWATDTTPTLEWLEGEHPEPAVIPADPLLRFASQLVEDFADEWLWRPALHYRWSYPGDAALLSRHIVDELLGDVPLPAPLKRLGIRLRQRALYVRGDGVTRRTRAAVEAVYRRALAALEPILQERPFLLGERPTLAYFGFLASMFRHFAQDPTPARIMRRDAPGVWAWVARLWNARASRVRGPVAERVPDDWSPFLDEIGAAYLPSLAANARAWRRGLARHDLHVPGVCYRGVRTSRYRVWCLERLRARFEALPDAARADARALLARHGAWDPLWSPADLGSGLDPEGLAPFARGAPLLGR